MSVENVPGYLAGATSDPLMTIMTVTLIVLVLAAGVLYFKLHAVPEHIAHGKNHTQIQLITILTILALFTHNNIFWVAALVLAVVELPDFLAPLKSIAKSLEVIAASKKNNMESEPTSSPAATPTVTVTKSVVSESQNQTASVEPETATPQQAATLSTQAPSITEKDAK